MLDTEPFERPRPTPQCLSEWALAKVALGTPPSDHLAGCAMCQKRLSELRAETAAAAWAPVPDALRCAAAPAGLMVRLRQKLGLWRSLAAAVPVAAAIFLFVRVPSAPPSPAPEVRPKGDAVIEATVRRDGAWLAQRTPVDRLPQLRTGDEMRLRIPEGRHAWVQLESWNGRAFENYFVGPRPPDGWLPVGIRLTESGQTKLRLRLCDKAPSQDAPTSRADCVTQTFAW